MLAGVNAVGLQRGDTATIPVPAQTAEDVAFTEPDASPVQPVITEFQDLMPWPGGVRRGA
jgi:hypothetical protein